MRAGFSLSLLIGLVAIAAPSTARGGDVFDFQYVTDAGPIEILNGPPQLFSLTLQGGHSDLAIAFLEFEIAGLSHTSPGDINIFLLPPDVNGDFGLEIMDDSGGQNGITDVDLVFRDGSDPLPADSQIISGTYRPLGPGTFSQYYNGTVFGDASWRILVIDDSAGGTGSFDSITLRGNYVPEPATLSLLMLGALAMLRYRRRP